MPLGGWEASGIRMESKKTQPSTHLSQVGISQNKTEEIAFFFFIPTHTHRVKAK